MAVVLYLLLATLLQDGKAESPETDITPRSVFLEVLTVLEGVPPKERNAALERVVAELHSRILAGDPNEGTLRQQRENLLLGLGALFDHSNLLARTPLVRSKLEGVVRGGEAKRRAVVVRSITLHGRNDAAKHFFLSATLTVVVGPFLAERIGRDKEILDAHRLQSEKPSGQGFSFVDLANDLAGIRYATWILGNGGSSRLALKPPPLSRFSPSFAELELPEGLDWDTFAARYYGEHIDAYNAIIAGIHGALDASIQGDEKPSKP